MAKYYKPSGKFNPIAFLYFGGISLIALPILGLLYAYAIWYIPFIYINFIIAGIFGFVIAFLINLVVVRYGKVRNPSLVFILSVIAGLIALYFHWAVWVDLVINAGESYGSSRIGITVSNIKLIQTFNLALQPGVLFDLIGEINKYGTWGIRSATVSGIFLTIIWIIEAIIIIGATVLTTIGSASVPFCELGNEWFKEKDLPAFNYVENTPEMIKNLENSNPESFKELILAESVEKNHSVFTLYSSNHNENYLTVTNKRAKTNKKGELEFDTNGVVEYIFLNSELKQALLAIK